MKKYILLTMVTVMAVAALSGCGNKTAEPLSTGTGTLTAAPSNADVTTPEPTATQAPTDTPTAEPTVTEAPKPTDTPVPTPTDTPIPTPTEVPHVHDYTRSVSVEATCTEDGEAVFACDCGDSYTESIPALGHTSVDAANAIEATCTEDGKTSDTVCSVCGEVLAEGKMIPATGHNWGTYKSNNDATYTKDGTETATCANCNKTDTRTIVGSKKEYTFSDKSATMWATDDVNVRDLPSTDGSKVGSLSKDQEVNVTGVCNETGWYRFDYDGKTAYVSDKYLTSTKPKPEDPAKALGQEISPENFNWDEAMAVASEKYPMFQVIDNGGRDVYFYFLIGKEHNPHAGVEHPLYKETYSQYSAILKERFMVGDHWKMVSALDFVETIYWHEEKYYKYYAVYKLRVDTIYDE